MRKMPEKAAVVHHHLSGIQPLIPARQADTSNKIWRATRPVPCFRKKPAQRLDKTSLPDYVIPMPLHPVKLREHGFNQSLLLATTVARKLDSGYCQIAVIAYEVHRRNPLCRGVNET